jgi:hypothetical protein
MPSPVPSFDHYFDMDIGSPHADWDYVPPSSDDDPEPRLSQNSSPLGDRRQRAPDPTHITRTYHPTINGT